MNVKYMCIYIYIHTHIAQPSQYLRDACVELLKFMSRGSYLESHESIMNPTHNKIGTWNLGSSI